MADVRCPICGEPWELDTLHDEVSHRFPTKPWYQAEKPDEFTYQNSEGRWHSQKAYEVYFKIVRKEFNLKGCEALTSYGGGHNKDTIDPKNSVYGQIMEFNGDDIDAAIGDMETAEAWGLID